MARSTILLGALLLAFVALASAVTTPTTPPASPPAEVAPQPAPEVAPEPAPEQVPEPAPESPPAAAPVTVAPTTPTGVIVLPTGPLPDTATEGAVAAAEATVKTNAGSVNAKDFCEAVEGAITTVVDGSCVVTKQTPTSAAGTKLVAQAAGVIVAFQVTTTSAAAASAFLSDFVAAVNSNGGLAGFAVTNVAAGTVVDVTTPPSVPSPVTPIGTTAVIDWVIIATSASFDTASQASFRNAIIQVLGGPANATVTINSVVQTTVGRKMTVQTSALHVVTTVTAPSYATSAAITAKLQESVRANNGRIGAFTVVSASGQTFSEDAAAFTRPTIAVVAVAAMFLAMLF